jgi:hypothetical protein
MLKSCITSQEVRVRVERARERVEEGGVEILARDLGDPARAQLVAVHEARLRLVQGRVLAHVVRDLEVHERALRGVALLGRRRVATLLGVEHELRVRVDRVLRVRHELAHELLGRAVARDRLLLQRGQPAAVPAARLGEHVLQVVADAVGVRLQEEHPLGVEALEEVVRRAAADLVGQRVEADVLLQEHLGEIHDLGAREGRPQVGGGGGGQEGDEEEGKEEARHGESR